MICTRQVPLENAVNDAKAMADALTGAGYGVTLVTNTTLASLKGALDQFGTSTQMGDIAVVYYAGHGFQIDGENYFVPVDFSASDPVTATKNAVGMSTVVAMFHAQKVHAGILIADACRNNPFNTTRSLLPGLAAMSASAGTLIALATYPGGKASDNPNGTHGVFTQALLDNLRTPGLDIEQVFSKVKAQVSSQTNGEQVPWTGSTLRAITLLAGGRSIPHESFTAPGQRATTMPPPAPIQLAQLSPRPTQTIAAANPQPPPTGPLAAPVPGASWVQPADGPAMRSVDPSALADIRQKIEAGQSQQAFMQYVGMLATCEDANGQLAALMGQLQLLTGHYQDAVSSLNTAAQKAPFDPKPIYLRAIANALLGRYQAALTDITARLSRTPNDPLFLMLEANIDFVGGDYKDAVALADKVIVQNQSQPAAYMIRGNSEKALGETGAATADFNLAARFQATR